MNISHIHHILNRLIDPNYQPITTDDLKRLISDREHIKGLIRKCQHRNHIAQVTPMIENLCVKYKRYREIDSVRHRLYGYVREQYRVIYAGTMAGQRVELN